ncbi:laccase domain-containing protein [bacterium]|nr:MAG: laccase domain-containing protein [bacterium]
MAPVLAGFSGLVHGFTTRSFGDFKAPGIPETLARGEKMNRLRLLRQVHGVRLVSPFDEEKKPSADGWTGVPPAGILLGVKTADCLSVLLYDETSGITAAVHAGWRSAVAGICAIAVREMERESARPSSIVAALGPSIGPCCFEVGPEVALAGAKRPECFRAGEAGKFFFDLPGYCAGELSEAGLSPGNISTLGLCTRCEEKLFFSHRRGDAGRMCSYIGRLR